jgi:hypothetical protein
VSSTGSLRSVALFLEVCAEFDITPQQLAVLAARADNDGVDGGEIELAGTSSSPASLR